MARQARLPFDHITTQSKAIFDLLHVDLWGPYHVSTYYNYKYFITLVDDYSRATWTHLLSTKSNALSVIQIFTNIVENQFQTTIKCMRSDNRLEFNNAETNKFLQSKGITHQKNCPYTPQQNIIVERKHKYLLETARALLFQSKLLVRYWGECILTTTYLINRLPSTFLKNKCPYEVLYKQKPKYNQLRSFGCLCYPTVPKVHRDKLEPRTTPHIFIGYPSGTKGYKVKSLATKRIHIFRDVVFHEGVFPFAMTSEKSTFPSVFKSIFPTSFPDCTDHCDILLNNHSEVIDAHNNLSSNPSPYILPHKFHHHLCSLSTMNQMFPQYHKEDLIEKSKHPTISRTMFYLFLH